ncbi:hypothetical protein PQX77_002724 [Marasmius sp. AFHP31]|nr:hypothetical protein PQX77_002724 [Marasmius sp. AFHP31]
MIINATEENNVPYSGDTSKWKLWHVYALASFSSTHSPYQQAGIMKPFVRILTFVNTTFKSQFNASKNDFDKVPSTGVIGIFLLVPPTPHITCPKGFAGIAPGFWNFDGFTFVKKPDNTVELSGDLLMTPIKTGPHILCAYADPPQFGDNEGAGDRGHDDPEITDLLFVSDNFEVKSSSTTLATPPETPSTVRDNDEDKKGTRHKGSDTAAIVGGIAGGIAVVCTFVVVLWRFRRRMHPDFTIEEDSARPASLTPYPLSMEVPAKELHQQRKEVERHPNNSDRHIQNDEQTRRERRVVHHEDSGIRPLVSSAGTLSESESVIHMPPSYSEANFRR